MKKKKRPLKQRLAKEWWDSLSDIDKKKFIDLMKINLTIEEVNSNYKTLTIIWEIANDCVQYRRELLDFKHVLPAFLFFTDRQSFNLVTSMMEKIENDEQLSSTFKKYKMI